MQDVLYVANVAMGFSWRKTKTVTKREALTQQAAELARPVGASLGDER